MFWGIFFIFLGVAFIVNHVFKVNVPILQIGFGLFLVYIGISWIFGSFNMNFKAKVTDSAAVFGKGFFTFPIESKKNNKSTAKYDIVFGSGAIDLRNVDLSNGDIKVKIDTVFGDSVVLLDKNTPYEIKSNTVFGSTSLPLENKTVVGSTVYRSENFDKGKNVIRIESNVVFGALKLTDNPNNLKYKQKAEVVEEQ